MGKSRLVAIFALASIIVNICPPSHAVQKTVSTPMRSQSSLLPPLRDPLSPLTRRQEQYYVKLMNSRGGENALSENDVREFCKSAGLLCGAALSDSASTSETRMGETKVATSLDRYFSQWRRTQNRQNSLPLTSTMAKMDAEPDGLHDHLAMTFFRETDLIVGTELMLPRFLYELHAEESSPSFLPASLALSLPPFDIHHLNDLLQFFHIPFDTQMARQVEETLDACTAQGLGKDDNFIISLCATSFEAMLKFASSMLDAPTNKIQALTNSKVVGSHGDHATIVRTMQLAAGHDAVDCHEAIFPFKVMGCHRIKDSKSLLVRVANGEGLDMDLLVACHKNTTLFNPHHEAFSQLHSSPGHTEICHFLPNKDVMWIPL